MSIQRVIFVWMAALIAVMWIATAAIGYWFVRIETGEFLDDQLRQVAIYVGDVPSLTPSSSIPYLDSEDHFLVQIWDGDGTPIRISDASVPLHRRDRTGFSTEILADERWRTFTLVGRDRIVQVSQQWSVRQGLAAGSAWRATLPMALLIPLSWLILPWAIGRAMRRVNQLAVAVAKRRPEETRPLEAELVPAEILPFVRSINDLLARVAGVLERQRRFVSDAAHELRTPLAALQIQAENLQRANHDSALLPPLADMEGGIRRASSMVAQLLRLARYDAEVSSGPTQEIDLTAITLHCVAEIAPLAQRKSIDLGVVRQDAARCVGSIADLSGLIGNLVDNAVRYTPAGGCVDIAIATDGGRASVTVTDSGPGIGEAHLARIFERFYRASSMETEGSGLGLAIAKAAADRNAATLHVDNRTDRSGLVVRMEIAVAI